MNLSIYEKFVLVCIFFIGFFLGRVATALEYAVFKEMASDHATNQPKTTTVQDWPKKFKWPQYHNELGKKN